MSKKHQDTEQSKKAQDLNQEQIERGVDPRIQHSDVGQSKAASDEQGVQENQQKAARGNKTREQELAEKREEGKDTGLSTTEERVGQTDRKPR